ncbi:hypothetical protein PJKIFABJ_00147 [Pseudomonas phage PE09]|uniref:dATP/dGTP diphosphohydrolase N-terminal domain-containing protein n=1 Tax=Pseudomonas phage PE09 TaxID=2696355 RepID=A0A9E6GTS5_9CAUD|nr:hypothetical protein QGX22_gp107 [Pseudomonas phage PE09]QHZ60083.1 hypothetical protein PJKIFABJ_00147 [Pseudomonas phage PE09]
MSVRALTIEEMYAQDEGTQVVFLGGWDTIPLHTTLTRVHKACDDLESVAYSYASNGEWEYFEEGEVGVVEVTTNTICAGRVCTDFSAHMELFQPEGSIIEQTEAKLGVFRPQLETRKIGKVRVELVDEGFPLALREVANVMTWAQTAKGYKDHDWQNLPNAEVALAAAASRHRTDHIKQRVVDRLDINQCVDVESNLLHKAHEAFGVLAQLELMLRGKFVDSRPQVGV